MKPLALLLCLVGPLALAQAGFSPPAVSPASAAPPAFPRPAFTPVGAGAPTPSQPGAYPAAEVPRSPNHRVLPATAEPGLWAADGAPRAGPPAPGLTILNLPITVITNKEERKCITTINELLGNYTQQVEALSPSQQRCLAAKLYQHCADFIASRMSDVAKVAAKVQNLSATPGRTVPNRMQKIAADMEQQACSEVTLGTIAMNLLKDIKSHIRIYYGYSGG